VTDQFDKISLLGKVSSSGLANHIISHCCLFMTQSSVLEINRAASRTPPKYDLAM